MSEVAQPLFTPVDWEQLDADHAPNPAGSRPDGSDRVSDFRELRLVKQL
jgi:hypothetical protein